MTNTNKQYKSLAESLMEEREEKEVIPIEESPIIWNKPVGIVKKATVLVNVRKEPNGEIVKVLKKGDKVVVCTEDCGNGWAQLDDGNFIRAEFLEG